MSLEMRWPVPRAEEQHFWNINTIMGDEGELVRVSFVHEALVIRCVRIAEGEVSAAFQSVEAISDVCCWESIGNSHCIQFLVVDAEAFLLVPTYD